MLVGAVVWDDVDDDANVQCRSLVDQLLGLGERPEHRVDVAVVGDVVASVGHRRRVPRREPDRVDPEIADVREPCAYALEVADAVTVAIREAAHVDLVNRRAAPPGPTVVTGTRRSSLSVGFSRRGGRRADPAGPWRNLGGAHRAA